jgi:hypothetical protein
MAITGLNVLRGNERTPEGWIKIAKDLNAGAGGEYLYFAYEMDGLYAPITDIKFLVEGSGGALPPGYRVIPVDLNEGTRIKGKSIHAAFTTDPDRGEPLEGLNVIISLTPDPTPDKPWERYDTDLNAGAGGKFIYLTRLQYRG